MPKDKTPKANKEPAMLPIPELPINWEDCTLAQLEWLAANGAYGQRIIADRYLREMRGRMEAWL
jgi:hypothetical protein